MKIMKNGIDVTDEIKAQAEKLRIYAVGGDHYQRKFKNCLVELYKAKECLESIKTPWMDDCIYENIEKISDTIEALERKIL